MEDQLWDLFRETGDPMGYLLYRAEEKRKTEEAQRRSEGKDRAEREPPAGAPSASV